LYTTNSSSHSSASNNNCKQGNLLHLYIDVRNFLFTFVIMDISNRIREIIEYYGYSPSEFADLIDVARSSISHITSGRNKASLDFIIKIKNRFPEIRWDWLIEGQGEMITLEAKNINENDPSYEQNNNDIKYTKTIRNDLFSNILEDNYTKNEIEVKPLENSQNVSKDSNKKSNIRQIVFFFDDGKFEIFAPSEKL